MADIVSLSNNFGRQNVLVCINSHTSGENEATAVFISGNWQQLATVIQPDDGTLFRYRGEWAPNTEYSADAIAAPSDDDGGSDDPVNDHEIAGRLRIGLVVHSPYEYSLTPAGGFDEATPLRIGLTPTKPRYTPANTIKAALEDHVLYDPDSDNDNRFGDVVRPESWNEAVETRGATGRRFLRDVDTEKEPYGERSWALIIPRQTSRQSTNLGGTRFEVHGATIIQIYSHLLTEKSQVENRALVAAGAIKSHFDSGVIKTRDGKRIILTGANVQEMGADGKWYVVRVIAPFRYYDTKE